jgi:hypothetical protein
VGSRTPSTRLAGCWKVNFLIFLIDILIMDRVTQYVLDIISLLEIGETSYILGSHHPRALQGLGFDLVLVERGGG